MVRGTLAVLAMLLIAGVAGCAGKAKTPSGPSSVVPQSIENVEVTDTTGAVRGVVFDSTIKPLAGVHVSINANNLAVNTSADGGFVFTGLPAGDYFISAEKYGFQSTQTSTTVVAGVKDPPVVKILLTQLANASLAYANLQVWNGFIECAVSAGIAADNVCGPLDSRFINYFTIDSIPTFMQAEMLWKTTQAVTPVLQLGFYQGGTTDWKTTQGQSPLLLTATGDGLVKARGNTTTDNPMRVFPPFVDTKDPTHTAATVVVNQAFDVYLTQFYGFTPRDGWLFQTDGACNAPQDCGGPRSST